jgi:hypothetical protein
MISKNKRDKHREKTRWRMNGSINKTYSDEEIIYLNNFPTNNEIFTESSFNEITSVKCTNNIPAELQ